MRVSREEQSRDSSNIVKLSDGPLRAALLVYQLAVKLNLLWYKKFSFIPV